MAGEADAPASVKQIRELKHVGDLLADPRPEAIERDGQR